MHSTLSMYYGYDAHVKGELLVIMKNSQSVNLLIFISNTLIELFNDFGCNRDGILKDRPFGEIVTHRFTLIVLSALRRSDNENMLSQSSRIRRILKDGGEALKLFKSSNQERYEYVGPEVTSSQDGQGHKMAKKRLCLVDDLKVFKITFKTS
ncbi:hypothetical protein Tco_0401129 [Tanacetum coccineum]